jgi:hypothetical protein
VTEAVTRLWVRLGHAVNALDPRPKTCHFIHIPKNGGTAVRLALTLRRVALERPIHARYVELEPRTDRRYFCVVRNPWSRTASRYLYTRRIAQEWPDTDPRKQYIMRASFEDYVEDRRVFGVPGQPHRTWHMSLWIDQLSWITDAGDEVSGDCLRFEALEEDLRAYFGRHVRVPRASPLRAAPYDYRSMFSDRTVQEVADTYARDIEYFGFDFHGAAVRKTYTLG